MGTLPLDVHFRAMIALDERAPKRSELRNQLTIGANTCAAPSGEW